MAAPSTLTMLDMSGVYVMNRTLSDSMEEILLLQGLSWFKRKAIRYATVTLVVKHYKDEHGVEHLDTTHLLTASIPGSTEKRTLSWTEVELDDPIFGPVRGKSRRTNVDALEHDFLKKDAWTKDTLDYGVIQNLVESDTPKSGIIWFADQVWGFEEVNGERRHTRRVKFTGPKGEDVDCRVVYDYCGLS